MIRLFQIYVGDIGRLSKIRLFHDNGGEQPGWHVDQLTLEDAHSKEQLRVNIDRWISQDRDDGETFREVPVLAIGHEPLPSNTF